MEDFSTYFAQRKEMARAIYDAQKSVYNPYFAQDVILNSDGFHHLQFSARRERNKQEQLLKFRLLPLALGVIKRSGTLQEYRKILSPVGKKSKRDGSTLMKNIEYWAFVAIVGKNNQIKIRTILRRIGDGNIIFWSVMPDSKFRKEQGQKLFSEGIEDE